MVAPEARYPSVSIITPTFNRAETLERAYNSLVAQSISPSEWIVVDDGSTDTTSTLIAQLAEKAPFPVKYVFQQNQHKKAAVNNGLHKARFEMVGILDSDDELLPGALEHCLSAWLEIPADQRNGFVGVTGLCVDQHGTVVGNRFPNSPLDSNPTEVLLVFDATGEKWGIQRREVLLKYPYPETIAGFVPESYVWSLIGERYQTRYINNALRRYHVQSAGSLSTGVTSGSAAQVNAPGMLLRYRQVLSRELAYFSAKPTYFLRAGANLVRYRTHLLGTKVSRSGPIALPGKLIALAMAPVGLAMFVRDRLGK